MCAYHGSVHVLLALALLQLASCFSFMKNSDGLPTDTFTRAQLCFCYMAGHCEQEDWDHLPAIPLGSPCQQGTIGLGSTSRTSSFLSYQDHNDVVTISKDFVKDMSGLSGADGTAILEEMIEAGRAEFSKKATLLETGHTVPDHQCIHQPACVTVKWLHLHTFSGTLAGESLPGSKLVSACSSGHEPVKAAAQQILQQASTDHVCQKQNNNALAEFSNKPQNNVRKFAGLVRSRSTDKEIKVSALGMMAQHD